MEKVEEADVSRMKMSFPATRDGMRLATEWCDDVCSSPRVAVIVDEIVSNIVRCSGARTFSMSLVHEADAVKMEIVDDGNPFNPLTAPEPDVTASVEERQIGGLGLFMVKKMARSVDYSRRGDINAISIVVHK